MKNKGILEKKGNVADTVDDYIAAAPEKEHLVLERLREIIKATAPEAEETISYRIPTYKYHGPLVHFAAFLDHNSFIVVNKSVLEKFEKELGDFHTTGTTIHFTSQNPLPENLIKKILKERMEQNEKRNK